MHDDRYKRTPGMRDRRKGGYRKDGYAVNPENSGEERGKQAFLAGLPRSANPCGSPSETGKRFKSNNWDKGWIKAKLAAEQGKEKL